MYRYDIGFVVLHYMNLEVTRKCVESIQKFVGTDKYKIVIVDNHSPNNSGNLLKNIYETNRKVKVKLNDSNDGFARGNNIGYSILKGECEFVCILNNDVELIENQFFCMIKKEYKRTDFGILGPRIKLLNGSYCSNKQKIATYKEERKLYVKKELRYLCALLGLNRCREIIASWKSRNKEAKSIYVNHDSINKEHTNILLNGCCLIYSRKYIENNEWAFDPRTEFYGEEALLYLHAMRQQLKMVYSPAITILHKESIATKTEKTSYRKAIFQLGHTAKSQKILLTELKQLEKLNNRGL